MTTASRRGFAGMTRARRKEIASMGGRRAVELGVGHRWTPSEAALAGSKGGTISRGGRGRLQPTKTGA